MALIQISDPEIKTEMKRKFSVGIDLGTTHSLIAERANNKITIFEDNGSPLIPSIVSEINGNLVIGQKYHNNSISSIKRLIGLNSNESLKIDFGELSIDSTLDMPRVKLGEKKYNVIKNSLSFMLYCT
jgi:molecular chaperone DnaK (HSP70)